MELPVELPDEVLRPQPTNQPPRPELVQTGFNPALARVPTPDTFEVPLQFSLDFVPSWTPRRIPVKCIGLTLPEGMEFLPPRESVPQTRRWHAAEIHRSPQKTG